MGLDIKSIRANAAKHSEASIKGAADAKDKAAAFFHLIQTLPVVANEDVSKYVDGLSIYELLELVLAHSDVTRARINAAKSHTKGNKARDFVRTEWAMHKQAYQNNKTAFARDYSRRVKNEMETDVTEKTIREVWLTDTLPASKRAG